MIQDGNIYRVDFIDRESPLYLCSPSFEHVLWLVKEFKSVTGLNNLQISSISLFNRCYF